MKCLVVRLFVLFSVCIYSSNSVAQTSLDTINSNKIYQLTLEDLMNIPIISSSKIQQKQSEAPSIVNVVSSDIFRSYDWHCVNDVLVSQPGFFQSHDYERQTVGFRGMFEGWNNNHLLMLIDGIPFNDNLYGTAYTWDITPMNFVNSMEIVFGPGGALYGSNAMNGVVALNTLNVRDLNGIGRGHLRFGSDRYQQYEIVTGVENDHFGVLASFSARATDGNEYLTFDASGREDGQGDPLKFRTNDSRSSSYFFTKFYGKNKYEGLMFQFHQQYWDFETGHGWLYVIPDRPESMKEFRRILALRYSPFNLGRRFKYEFTTRFQIHGIDWNMRYYNDGALGGYYPDGVSEYLNTSAKDLFVRAQTTYAQRGHSVIFGLENSTFFYNGDKAHYANIDMNTFADPNEQNYFDLKPWLEYVVDKPVYNIASYVQYMSPYLFKKVQVTLSGRFDRMFFRYTDLMLPEQPQKSKSFQMFTPRIGLVYSISDNLVLKAVYGKAFRTPSPTEMFGRNTYTLASNINELKPEIVTNIDLGLTFGPYRGFNVRVNGFLVNFENQIAYSVANENLSTNIYSLKTLGAEFSAQYAAKRFSGYTNLTYSYRFDEDILDSTISLSKSRVTWAPSLLIKIGGMYKVDRLSFSASGYFQNRAYRRNSDKFDGMINYRPVDYVDGWFCIDLKGSYKLTKKSELGISVKNVFDAKRYLMKNNEYLFDYQMQGRMIFGEYVIRF